MPVARRRWSGPEVLDKLNTSNVFLERALLALYDRQTDDEQRTSETREHNGVGFNGVDAPILSSMAQWAQRRALALGRFPACAEGERLTERQRVIVRRKLRKYVRQLVAHANREG